MPCSSGMGDPGWSEINELRRKNDELTRMLCSLLRSLDDHIPHLPSDVVEWYAAHREWDASQGRP